MKGKNKVSIRDEDPVWSKTGSGALYLKRMEIISPPIKVIFLGYKLKRKCPSFCRNNVKK